MASKIILISKIKNLKIKAIRSTREKTLQSDYFKTECKFVDST